ncbi:MULTISPECIES: esterase/lipase family protein [Paenibacillus]|uniref:esterase/lipase family protein n=1 Tax=Paenibacillus TaxID=44249 RepID=UPI0022B8D637|nr:alpha/beta hydrolase [Paenibacillus caseinilyticus]MCZ8523951.1 alpha/beta hydrolase [Paenibacillus caseinilyticus]
MFRRPAQRVATLLITAAVLAVPAAAGAAAPAPILHNDNPSANAGDWYTGAVPPGASADKPVILFVQGLHSNYSTWLGADRYYEAAYNAGYRTAFVQLQDADGPGGSMWTNGAKLAEVIRKVAEHYGVSKINIIAHSKGGIDTQTALVHYGAAPYVNVVHQLSTPNKGSELADLAYSSWASWLADILGKNDDAVYSLQTSYMANFRAQTDGRAENKATVTYTSGGMGDDGWFTGYWFAHAILPGEDDGAVSLDSAFGLPNGIRSFSKDISHSAMAKASETWSLVRPKLSAGSGVRAMAASPQGSASAAGLPVGPRLGGSAASADEAGGFIFRGGEVAGTATASFPLESGLKAVSLEVLTSKADTSLVLRSPSGRSYAPAAVPASADAETEAVFNGAVRHAFKVEKPEAGVWTLEAAGQNDAYFAAARLEEGTKAKTRVTAPKKVYRQGERAQLGVDLGTRVQGSLKRAELHAAGKGTAAQREQRQEGLGATDGLKDGKLSLAFEAPQEPGVYNLSLDVEGTNERGEKVTRSVIYNFAVTDASGKLK